MKSDIDNEETCKEAARWAERHIDDDPTSAETGSFRHWVLADESHAREYRAHFTLAKLARDLPADETLLAVENPPARRRVWLTGLAASLMLAVSLGGWLAHRHEAASLHITTAATTRDVTLSDGSVAHLNVRTELRWLGDDDERRVALLGGEALFEVRHDAAKPFAVAVDDSEIRVLGTRFNVRRRDSMEVVLTVLEGTVRASQRQPAWTRTLHANEQLVYNDKGLVRDVHVTTANAAKWREGILEFEDESLANIVEDLGRYTDRRIIVRDPRVAQLRLGGQLDVRDDVKWSLALLEKLAPLAVHERGNDFVLDYRQAPTQEKR